MGKFQTPDVSVSIGDGVAILRRQGVSEVVVAGILGVETDATGAQVVYLDRLVHRPGEDNFIGWKVWGAVSSIMTQIL